MDNFKSIYRILSELEKSMDYQECDISRIDHEQLGISEERWNRLIKMMCDSVYIQGVIIKKNIYDEMLVDCKNIEITLKGLEYLQENSMMKKAHKTIKGINDVVPGL